MLCLKYHDMIEAKYFRADSSSIDNTGKHRLEHDVEFAKEKEKAKAAESNAKAAEANAKTAEANAKIQILELMKTLPDKFDELIKLLTQPV